MRSSSTALLGDGPSFPFHVGADPNRVRFRAYPGFTTKHGDRSGLIQETPLAEPSTLRLRSVESTRDYRCEDASKGWNVLAREGPNDASDTNSVAAVLLGDSRPTTQLE